ncbi:cation transport ATPase [Leucobacter exalbidus]|uniref:Cation transport ATPase n=1 Tax=Leucobacter exalbidus TaxID=662960 RepID=A0A940PY61_9MICO|nr:hypothetical protein [Leucobacter exalbidus]MBP1327231.1 cation transport ATPase [Leucobacter exalbidus]
MTVQRRRGVTRGYVTALVAATSVVAVALVVASWGMIALATGRDPVATDHVASWAAPVLVMIAVALFATSLWRQAIALLRGRQRPSWGLMVSAIAGSYLVWSLGGMLAGMTLAETWLSPYALALAASWLLANLAGWGVLVRRVYTDRPAPRWPWERAEENE